MVNMVADLRTPVQLHRRLLSIWIEELDLLPTAIQRCFSCRMQPLCIVSKTSRWSNRTRQQAAGSSYGSWFVYAYLRTTHTAALGGVLALPVITSE